jgi:hypothetical protein
MAVTAMALLREPAEARMEMEMAVASGCIKRIAS